MEDDTFWKKAAKIRWRLRTYGVDHHMPDIRHIAAKGGKRHQAACSKGFHHMNHHGAINAGASVLPCRERLLYCPFSPHSLPCPSRGMRHMEMPTADDNGARSDKCRRRCPPVTRPCKRPSTEKSEAFSRDEPGEPSAAYFGRTKRRWCTGTSFISKRYVSKNAHKYTHVPANSPGRDDTRQQDWGPGAQAPYPSRISSTLGMLMKYLPCKHSCHRLSPRSSPTNWPRTSSRPGAGLRARHSAARSRAGHGRG